MKIYYRISNNSYKKNRLPNATKEHCLEIFLKYFDVTENQIYIIADNVNDPNLSKFIDSKCKSNIIRENTSLNNAHSFRHCLYRACEEVADNEFVYFAEDDYLYVDGCFLALKEGLDIANYVTLYDCPDKYIDAQFGGNPQIENGGEITRLVRTEHFHWKLTNSTTMTFGSKGSTIKKDKQIWEKYLLTSYPRDYDTFCELVQIQDRSVISSVPGKSTHSELPWLSPFIEWEKI